MICLPRCAAVLLPAAVVLAAPLFAEDAFPLRAVEFRRQSAFFSRSLGENCPTGNRRPGAQKRLQRRVAASERNGRVRAPGVQIRAARRRLPRDVRRRRNAPELFPVRFDGFDAPDEEIRQMLAARVPLFGDRVPPTGPMAAAIGNALQGWWKQRGNDSKVEGRLVPAGNERFAMLFGPRRETSRIAFVRFSNTGSLSALELQRKFNQAAMGEAYGEAPAQGAAPSQCAAALCRSRLYGREILPL